MPSYDPLTTLLLLWIVVIGLILLIRWKRYQVGGGLLFAYIINLWMIHWVANALYLAPWYAFFDREILLLGLEQSVYGLVGFAVGSLILAALFIPSERGDASSDETTEYPPQLPVYYMGFGILSYMLQSTPLGGLPTVTALVSVGQNLFILGVCLACRQAWKTEKYWAFVGWIGVMATIPFVTILTRGFIGYGVVALLVVVAFISSFVRPRWRVVAIGLVVCYMGLSVYINYMRDRNDIRDTVWGGASYVARVDQLIDTFVDFEWFDWENEAHFRFIDLRLNQNLLIGMAVRNLEDSENFAEGETIWQAFVAFVPRIIWPEKPVFAGSPDLVARYTGLQFARGTSVGVGQVMEFYINFGTTGVVIGFILFGLFITLLDAAAWRRLRRGDWQRFTLWYMIGISFLQVGGSMVEIAGSAAAAGGAAWLVNNYLTDRFQMAQPAPASAPAEAHKS